MSTDDDNLQGFSDHSDEAGSSDLELMAKQEGDALASGQRQVSTGVAG